MFIRFDQMTNVNPKPIDRSTDDRTMSVFLIYSPPLFFYLFLLPKFKLLIRRYNTDKSTTDRRNSNNGGNIYTRIPNRLFSSNYNLDLINDGRSLKDQLAGTTPSDYKVQDYIAELLNLEFVLSRPIIQLISLSFLHCRRFVDRLTSIDKKKKKRLPTKISNTIYIFYKTLN